MPQPDPNAGMNQLGAIMKIQGLQNEMQANQLQAQKYQQDVAASQATERRAVAETKWKQFQQAVNVAGDNSDLLIGTLQRGLQDPDIKPFLGDLTPQHVELIRSNLTSPENIQKLRWRLTGGYTPEVEMNMNKSPTTLGQLQQLRDRLDRTDPMYSTKLDEVNRQIAYEQTRAPGTRVEVNTGTEKKYGEEFGRNVATQDSELLSAARSAPRLAQSAVDIMTALNSGDLISGAGADFRLTLAKVLDLAGKTPDEKIANTEALISSMGQATLNSIASSKLGAGQGFTDKDLLFLQNVAGGKISMSLENIQRLADLQYRASEQSVSAWDARRKTMPQSILADTGLGQETYVLPPKNQRGVSSAQTAPATTTIPRVTNDAEFHALPSGATFIDPNGIERRKP